LIATCSGYKALYVWDLRRLRAQLKEMDLDWDWPEFPETGDRGKHPRFNTPSLRVRVDSGFLTRPILADAQQAVGVYSLALALCPLNPEAYLQRGWAYSRLRNYENALQDFEHLLTLKTDLFGHEGLYAFLCNNVAWYQDHPSC
jgi:tetratricopeptide (TPR) repeat protein